MSVIEWLHSPEGEEWSYNYCSGGSQDNGGNPARHSTGLFASIKYDHEGCTWNTAAQDYICSGPIMNQYSYTDNLIRSEIERFGMNGIPPNVEQG